MIAKTQYPLGPADLELILAVTRGGTLAESAKRLAVDTSTVFRAIQRLEKQLGQPLFERSRGGYLPTEITTTIARHAERMEAELEEARTAIDQQQGLISGTVRLTTTDTILHGLVLPKLGQLRSKYPALELELIATNELANLSKRDADIAIRPTRRPPPHLVGKKLGLVRAAVYASKKYLKSAKGGRELERYAWVAPDDSLPEHPSVKWRRRHFPKLRPRYRCNSILMVAHAISAGLGIGVVPAFLAQADPRLQALTDYLPECETDLWILTHPDSRHLRRIAALFSELGDDVALP